MNIMKKSILIIATMALATFNASAKTEKENYTVAIETVEMNKNDLVQLFDWSVKSKSGIVSGTSTSLKKAEEMVKLMSTTELASEQKIESYYVLRSEMNKKRLYAWEVKSTNGYAMGYSYSEASAEKMIALVASGDVISSKIVTSSKLK